MYNAVGWETLKVYRVVEGIEFNELWMFLIDRYWVILSHEIFGCYVWRMGGGGLRGGAERGWQMAWW